MTSTVLDVTVLLLCVSASVIVLGDVGGDIGTEGPTVDDVADRLVTETVTATYDAPDAPGGTRTVHATRAELLAMLAVADGRNADANSEQHAAFGSSARSAVSEDLGPRVRVDVRAMGPTATATERNATDSSTAEPLGSGIESAGDAPAIDETIRSVGPPWQSANETGTPSWPTAATGTPWSVALGDEIAGSEGGTERKETIRGETAIGASPPKTADTTTAVIDHPAPGGTGDIEVVRIVVRRW